MSVSLSVSLLLLACERPVLPLPNSSLPLRNSLLPLPCLRPCFFNGQYQGPDQAGRPAGAGFCQTAFIDVKFIAVALNLVELTWPTVLDK